MTQHEYEQRIIDLFKSGRASAAAWQELGEAIVELYGTDLEEVVENILVEVGRWEDE